jgi:hypothetical protein
MSPEEAAERYNHQKRYLSTAYTVMAVLYFLMGAALIIEERVRTRIPYFTDWPNSNQMTSVPSGSSDSQVQAYYNYLHNWNLAGLKETYLFSPAMLTWIYMGIGMLLIIFIYMTNAWYARHRQGDLYPVEVYNGYITERGGKVDYFNWAVYIILGSFMLYYATTNLIYGQIY